MIIEYIFLNVFFSGRIQTLNPYSRDDISSATFSKVCIIWKTSNLKILKIWWAQVWSFCCNHTWLENWTSKVAFLWTKMGHSGIFHEFWKNSGRNSYQISHGCLWISRWLLLNTAQPHFLKKLIHWYLAGYLRFWRISKKTNSFKKQSWRLWLLHWQFMLRRWKLPKVSYFCSTSVKDLSEMKVTNLFHYLKTRPKTGNI